jgi:hypothetical protein
MKQTALTTDLKLFKQVPGTYGEKVVAHSFYSKKACSIKEEFVKTYWAECVCGTHGQN